MTEDEFTDTDLSSSSDSELDDTDSSSSDNSSDSEDEKITRKTAAPKKVAAPRVTAPKKRSIAAADPDSDSDSDDSDAPPSKRKKTGKTSTAFKPSSTKKSKSADNDENEPVNEAPPPEGMLLGGVDVSIEGGEQERIVYNYMRAQNRPYAAQQVFENLHEKVKKSQVPKVLEALAVQGVLVEKVFGKSKIYHVNQDHMPRGDTDAIASLEYKIKMKNKDYSEVRSKLSAIKNEVTALEASPGNEEGERLIEETQQRIVEKEARLAEIKASLDEHKAADVDRLKHRFYLMLGEWKKRKKAAMDMMGMYLEQVTKTAKVFINEQGLETDEAMGQDVKVYTKLCDDLGCAKVKLPGKASKK